MAKITPVRVSLYDFLCIDSLPIASSVADSGHISIPQAKIVIHCAIEVTVSALLAYQQDFDGDSILKKLLARSQVKELRRYNAFNLHTMQIAMQYGLPMLDALYKDSSRLANICQKIAAKTDTSVALIRPLLGALTLLNLREIAILADYAQLNGQEMEQWLQLQPQFLQLDTRPIDPLLDASNINKTTALASCDDIGSHDVDNPANTSSTDNAATCVCLPHTQLIKAGYVVADYDNSWHELTGFISYPVKKTSINSDTTPHYAKVIGRVADTNTDNTTLDQQDDRILAFATMPDIRISNQRWLLKLAKIADIYLSRNRLRIASEPEKPPSRPLIAMQLLANTNNTQSATGANEGEQTPPVWRNPVVLLIIAVIGGLAILAVIKYQYKTAKTTNPKPALTSQAHTNNTHITVST